MIEPPSFISILMMQIMSADSISAASYLFQILHIESFRIARRWIQTHLCHRLLGKNVNRKMHQLTKLRSKESERSNLLVLGVNANGDSSR